MHTEATYYDHGVYRSELERAGALALADEVYEAICVIEEMPCLSEPAEVGLRGMIEAVTERYSADNLLAMHRAHLARMLAVGFEAGRRYGQWKAAEDIGNSVA